jgi:cytochrome c553
MHNHHGVLDLSGKSPGDTGYNAGTNGSNLLFPPMPSPAGRNVATKDTILGQTCYMCHPGKKTACLRGAMGQANVVCQDCHGSMTQVGNDFSRNMPGGQFILAGDFYSLTSTTPRVPWANEPGCGSCHTGDAMSNLATSTGVIPASDSIRLLQAYRIGDAKATPVVPTNKRFAEDTVAATDNPNAAGNPKLYRVSVGGAAATNGGQSGHSGLFCEACHGATHAEWSTHPTVPNANDNVTSNQLQSHSGVISECSTCHGSNYTGTNLNGPHGMHPVGNTTFATDAGHPNLARSNVAQCQACHGQNGQGTVLSKLPVARTLGGTSRPAGYQVSCGTCHSNFLSTGVLVGGN